MSSCKKMSRNVMYLLIGCAFSLLLNGSLKRGNLLLALGQLRLILGLQTARAIMIFLRAEERVYRTSASKWIKGSKKDRISWKDVNTFSLDDFSSRWVMQTSRALCCSFSAFRSSLKLSCFKVFTLETHFLRQIDNDWISGVPTARVWEME